MMSSPFKVHRSKNWKRLFEDRSMIIYRGVKRPYSGKFNLRLPPELHREMAIMAKRMNVSINGFVEKAIVDELRMVTR